MVEHEATDGTQRAPQRHKEGGTQVCPCRSETMGRTGINSIQYELWQMLHSTEGEAQVGNVCAWTSLRRKQIRPWLYCDNSKDQRLISFALVIPDGGCSMPLDPGPCRLYVVKWYYDPEANACAQFWYGGCWGNANNFDTESKCRKSCVST